MSFVTAALCVVPGKGKSRSPFWVKVNQFHNGEVEEGDGTFARLWNEWSNGDSEVDHFRHLEFFCDRKLGLYAALPPFFETGYLLRGWGWSSNPDPSASISQTLRWQVCMATQGFWSAGAWTLGYVCMLGMWRTALHTSHHAFVLRVASCHMLLLMALLFEKGQGQVWASPVMEKTDSVWEQEPGGAGWLPFPALSCPCLVMALVFHLS